MNPRPTPTPLLAAIAAAFSLTLAACGGGNGEAPPVAPSAPQVAVAPVITITNDIPAEVATGQIVFTFSFNRDVGTTFTAEDVAVTGGTKGAFTRASGTRATLVVVPAPNTTGTVQVSVASGAVTDALGAPNAAVTAQKAFNTVAPPPPPPATGTVLLADFDTVRPTAAGFEGAEGSAIEAGPAGGGSGLSFKVLRSGGQNFALGLIETAVPVPVTATRRTVSAQVFSPVAGIPMVMKLEGPNNANTGDVTANEPVVVGWQTLTWTFTTATPSSTYNKIVLLPNLGTVDAPPGRAYFFDSIELRETPVAPPPPVAGGTVVANFDDINPPAAGFEGAEGSAVETGPAGGGSGRSFKVLRSGGQNFALGLIDATVPVTATRRTVSAQVFSPVAGVPMVMKLEGPNNANTGDVAANEAVVAGWQTLTWTFSTANPAATYNKIVLLPNLGTVDAPPGRAYFFDTITLLGETAPPPVATGTVLANFDDISPPAAGFEGAEGSAIETGPAGGGTGRSFKVLRSGGQNFALGIIDVTVPVTATRRTVSAQVFSPVAGIPMVMKLEGPNSANTGDVAANETVAVGWQTLTWTFSTANPAATYNKIVLLPNLGTVDAPPGRAYFFDTITLLGQPAAGGGGGAGAFAGVWANDYLGDLFVNSRSAQGGDVGFFFDDRLAATKAYDYAGVAGNAQNPGGVPNFYFGFGLNPPAITNAFFGAFVKAPGNGVVNLSSYARLKVNVWGPDQLFRAGTFPTLRVVLQGPPRAGCASPSGGSEVQTDFATTSQGAAAVYTLTLANFTIAHACNGETSVAQVLSAINQMNILLLNANIQYTNRDPDGVAFTNGLNVGTLVFE